MITIPCDDFGMGTTDNVMRRRGGMARSDDRRLAELAREWFADARDTPQSAANGVATSKHGRKKRTAKASDADDYED